MHCMIVAGARPNFMKVAPIINQLESYAEVETTLVHTGQHYDKNLSTVFFEELEIKKPDISLGVGSGSHAQQTAAVMVAIEEQLLLKNSQDNAVDVLIVVGDVNSTLAASLAAAKLHVPIAHVEAGLRSRDRMMPEEINRLATDAISDMHFCSEPAGKENLIAEGVDSSKIHLVGNVMIDTLLKQVNLAKKSSFLSKVGLSAERYGVVTLHRPSNVDHPAVLESILTEIADLGNEIPMVFPVHPRTRSKIEEFGLSKALTDSKKMVILEPLGYRDFLCLTSQAKVIITDSGGLQEESTALGVPCLTMRSNTERPITCTEGTSTLIGNSALKLRQQLELVISGKYKKGSCPALWDGRAAERIARILVTAFKPSTD
ncbi:UDP-N-acetylglucosamine 2-epimerase (non-hydrolyzing) [Rubripirellula sp.]|nr:UDP-N-acetylglucosamine 2-epimerase (non-hydrolyzing) [Rubripirellula sp.]